MTRWGWNYAFVGKYKSPARRNQKKTADSVVFVPLVSKPPKWCPQRHQLSQTPRLELLSESEDFLVAMGFVARRLERWNHRSHLLNVITKSVHVVHMNESE